MGKMVKNGHNCQKWSNFLKLLVLYILCMHICTRPVCRDAKISLWHWQLTLRNPQPNVRILYSWKNYGNIDNFLNPPPPQFWFSRLLNSQITLITQKSKYISLAEGKSDSDSICTVASYIFHGRTDKAQIRQTLILPPLYLAKDKTQNRKLLAKDRQLSHSAVNSCITGQVINTKYKIWIRNTNPKYQVKYLIVMLHLLLLLSASVLAQVLHHPH